MKKIIFLFLIVISFNAIGATFTVNKTTDTWVGNTYTGTAGELRYAINQANASIVVGVKDIIKFDFIGLPLPITINLTKDYINITDDLIIDGNSQIGSNGTNPKIRIVPSGTYSNSGKGVFWLTNAGSSNSEIKNIAFNGHTQLTSGLIIVFGSSNNVFEGLVFSGNNYKNAIRLGGASNGNVFKANYFGTEKTLTQANNTNTIAGIDFSFAWGNPPFPESNIVGGGNNGDRNYFYNFNGDVNGGGVLVYKGKNNKILNNIYVNNNKKNINLRYDLCNISLPGASNNCKQPPTITSANINPSGSTYTATIQGTCVNGDIIEVYKTNSTNIDAIELVGTVTATSTNWSLVIPNTTLGVNDKLVATATSVQGTNYNTSEFTPQPVSSINGCNTCSTIDFTWSGTLCPNKPITFTPTTSGCNFSGSAPWVWDFGDGTPPTTNNVHTFTGIQSYNVKYYLPAVGTCAEVKVIKPVSIVQCPPATGCSLCTDFDFYFPNRICVGEKVTFEKILACQNPVTATWDFGDGTPPATSPEHIYTTAGSYNVIMSIPGCARSKSVNVVGCPEFSCDPALPCNQLGLSVTIKLNSSTITGTGGTYNYEAVITNTAIPAYVGGYTYVWTVTNDPNITYTVNSTNNALITINKGINAIIPFSMSCTVIATGAPYVNCSALGRSTPCANFGANISQVSFSIPNASYKAVVSPITPVSSSYSYLWSLETPVPANAVITNTAGGACTPAATICNLVSVTGIQNAPANPNGVALKLKALVRETGNGSNGCIVAAYKDDEPCSDFKPIYNVSANQTGLGNNKRVRYEVPLPISGGSGSGYTYHWVITNVASGQTAVIVGASNTNSVVVEYTSATGPVNPNSPPFIITLQGTVTDTGGKKCSKIATSLL